MPVLVEVAERHRGGPLPRQRGDPGLEERHGGVVFVMIGPKQGSGGGGKRGGLCCGERLSASGSRLVGGLTRSRRCGVAEAV
jgi:hypothetical protein